MATKQEFKYVCAVYYHEVRSVWRVPVEWEAKDISVRWDSLGYKGEEKDDTVAVKIENQEVYGEGNYASPQCPDSVGTEQGTQEGLMIGSAEECADVGFDICVDDKADLIEEEKEEEKEEEEEKKEEEEEEPECECCDSKKLAIKVNGLYVCEECNNFECGRCGVQFDDTSDGNNWESRFKMCLCVECRSILEIEQKPPPKKVIIIRKKKLF